MDRTIPDECQRVKALKPRGHILITMNLRLDGGPLRPDGHITCTVNLCRGCRPVNSTAALVVPNGTVGLFAGYSQGFPLWHRQGPGRWPVRDCHPNHQSTKIRLELARAMRDPSVPVRAVLGN